MSLLNRKKIQTDIDLLIFGICFVIFISIFLFLFKYWFAVYVVLFFVSIWSVFKIPPGYKKVRSGIIAYFVSYVVSAILGFAFIAVS